MKVELIKAYKSEDGGIWEFEGEAVYSNIQDIIDNNLEHSCENSDTEIREDILKWFRDFPKDIKYIQANISKLLPEHFGEE
jgi:hypothetical protein